MPAFWDLTPTALLVVILLLNTSHTRSAATVAEVINYQRAPISVAAAIIVESREIDSRRDPVISVNRLSQIGPSHRALLCLSVQGSR